MCIRDRAISEYDKAVCTCCFRDFLYFGEWCTGSGSWRGTVSVSYTHLDVYKRQIINYVAKERLDQLSETGAHQGVIAQVAAYEYASVEDILAVSYTHLDVYKRQV